MQNTVRLKYDHLLNKGYFSGIYIYMPYHSSEYVLLLWKGTEKESQGGFAKDVGLELNRYIIFMIVTRNRPF